jgi:hypothetical protein
LLETTIQLVCVLLVAAISGAAAIYPWLQLFFWARRSDASARIIKDFANTEPCNGRPVNNEAITMTFEQIGYFLALAAEGTFIRAARRCGVSQPSLTNAIKSLEISLGAQLFERTPTGSELTNFGRQMYPLLARLHYGKLRALKLARTLDGSTNRMLSVWPRLSASKRRPVQGRPQRRAVTVTLTALLACMVLATGRSAQARDKDAEAAIYDVLPAPIRCGTTSEPLFYCRHEDAARHNMTLELASGLDGPSASLTHDYDEARRHQLFAVMREFFIKLGVPADAFDQCTSQSQWGPALLPGNNLKLLCYRVELGDRVTHDIFVVAADEHPKLARATEGPSAK